MYAKKSRDRVWQSARFDSDIEFWTSRFGERCSPTPISAGQSLRFTLFDESDFEKFKKALTTELSGIVFYGGVEEGDTRRGSVKSRRVQLSRHEMLSPTWFAK
jgi:hypothetical protein